ncbi:unnamed protein product [Cuscuta europaea]|uniref:Reverse transcriptase Ty1/copia-type domain-containing protein n=1 Tax=Cuscuta europaea TaxID=41803 RepID=A0A9P1EHL3_CUSEU|nr:unnamed protein product [Cuscuta europaea]
MQNRNHFWVVCLYVDEIIYMGSSQSMVDDFKSSMMEKFEMTDLGVLKYFSGLEVTQREDDIFISQEKYATDLLKNHMSECKTATTPMNINEKLQCNDGTKHADGRMYMSLVGGLNYLTH